MTADESAVYVDSFQWPFWERTFVGTELRLLRQNFLESCLKTSLYRVAMMFSSFAPACSHIGRVFHDRRSPCVSFPSKFPL